LPEVVQLSYQRAEPVKSAPRPVEKLDEVSRQLSASEQLFYWLRRLGSLAIIGAGALWLIFVFLPDKGIWTMGIGAGLIGLGFALLMFSGPSSAEKKGYHF
jgi:hypothetical protein